MASDIAKKKNSKNSRDALNKPDPACFSKTHQPQLQNLSKTQPHVSTHILKKKKLNAKHSFWDRSANSRTDFSHRPFEKILDCSGYRLRISTDAVATRIGFINFLFFFTNEGTNAPVEAVTGH